MPKGGNGRMQHSHILFRGATAILFHIFPCLIETMGRKIVMCLLNVKIRCIHHMILFFKVEMILCMPRAISIGAVGWPICQRIYLESFTSWGLELGTRLISPRASRSSLTVVTYHMTDPLNEWPTCFSTARDKFMKD